MNFIVLKGKKNIKRFICTICIILMLASLCTFSVAENEPPFRIWFLDVGQGDAAVVCCDGYYLMIDGGPSDKSDFIYSFLKQNGIERIDYMIATHPDADHIGGLSGALNYATAGVVMCTVKKNDTKQFESLEKNLNKQKKSIIVPDAGDSFSLGEAHVEILYPSKGEILNDNTSIAVKITYIDTSYLFMGDCEEEDENKILENADNISADVLKVGHHGSSTSSGEKFLEKVNPKYAVISVGEDNAYKHPTDGTVEKLEKINATVYRTDLNGTIICTSDGKTVNLSSEKNPDNSVKRTTLVPVTEEPQKSNDEDYIANTNTMKFHHPWCSSVSKMKESNKMYFTGNREDLIAKGYVPCKKCNP